MAEQELELRLRAAALALDEGAPAFDVDRLPARSAHRTTVGTVASVCVLALALGAAAAPAAVSAIRGLFEVDVVAELGSLEPGVAEPYPGRSVPVDSVQGSAPFRVRTIPALGVPVDARVRDDVTGGLVTLVFRDGTLLTQWQTTDVSPRLTVVPVSGSTEDVAAGDLPAMWIEGAARGTFTLVGADGTVHRESFDVGSGALLWMHDGMTFLLQGAVSKAHAAGLAAEVER
jgi:hypothetical protein